MEAPSGIDGPLAKYAETLISGRKVGWYDACWLGTFMYPYISVRFERMVCDSSVEASVHRWVARLESPTVSVQRALVTIEQVGRSRTTVRTKLDLVDGTAFTATTAHEDIYVAVADAFRAVRREVLERVAMPGRARFGMALAG